MPSDSSDIPNEAVLISFKTQGDPRDTWDDFMNLEDTLSEAIDRKELGEFDGIERGDQDVVFFMYGPDAEKLFEGIQEILRASPLAKSATVVIRRGEPGAPARELRI